MSRRLIDRQRRLAQHVTTLHKVHEPWGVSPFEVQSALLGIPAEARTPVRLASPEQITRDRADQIRDELREFAHLGGFTFRPDTTPWFGAKLRTPDEVRHACDLAARLGSHALPMLATASPRQVTRPACGLLAAMPSAPAGYGCSRP